MSGMITAYKVLTKCRDRFYGVFVFPFFIDSAAPGCVEYKTNTFVRRKPGCGPLFVYKSLEDALCGYIHTNKFISLCTIIPSKQEIGWVRNPNKNINGLSLQSNLKMTSGPSVLSMGTLLCNAIRLDTEPFCLWGKTYEQIMRRFE